MFEHEDENSANASLVEAVIDHADAVEETTDEPSAASEASPAADSPVAAALTELDTLADRDLTEHPAVFERIHGELHAALTAIDDA